MIEIRAIITEINELSEFTNEATAIILPLSIEPSTIECVHPHPPMSEQLKDVTVVHTKSGNSYMLNVDYVDFLKKITTPNFFVN